MILGFTGSSGGLTDPQRREVRSLLASWSPLQAHHGDCEGADAEFHILCQGLRIPLVGHPPLNGTKRAFCAGFEIKWPRKDYLARNHDIVDSSDRMLACPGTPLEVLRSGTWATVRYSRKTNTPLWIVLPDGTVRGPDE